MSGSLAERVRVEDAGAHQMYVVQGMHPQYVMQRQSNLEVLERLFKRVLGPFGVWQSRRAVMQQSEASGG